MKIPAKHDPPSAPKTPKNCNFPVFSDTKPKKPIKGRFKQGESGNPKGRPKGALNRSTLAARAILERNAGRLMAKAVELAMAGSPIALKLCLERLVSVPQDRPLNLTLPKQNSTPGVILATHEAVLSAIAAGDITPQEGQSVSSVVEARRRSWESIDLADRISALENRAEDLRTQRAPKIVWHDDPVEGDDENDDSENGNNEAAQNEDQQ